MSTEAQRARALKLAERLVELIPVQDDTGLSVLAQDVIDRLKTPMSVVLEKVPGDSVVEKCRKIGITRQNYYCWLKGDYRPNRRQAKRLASLTGIDADAIRPA